MDNNRLWHENSVLYQVYIRSFMDGNHDGMGDLQGVISKLDYIKSLGVDAIWITPFFLTPDKDFGYDIQDYFSIDPRFGDFTVFNDLISKASEKKLKIIIDLAISHSSDQCEWFQQSKLSKINKYSDWYVWADSKPNGDPPNNWKSIFGGNAWTWCEERKQFYFHNFLKEQPDFNFHNSEVQSQMLKIIDFWFQKGISGIRLDVCNFYFHNVSLKDNPPRPKGTKLTGGSTEKSPYQEQLHIFDKDQPENLEFLKSLRAVADKYKDSFLMAEIASDNQFEIMEAYTKPGLLHSAYSFEFLTSEFDLKRLVETNHKSFEKNLAWSLSNHDVERVASRWAKERDPKFTAKAMMALLSFFNGVICIYQGEEAGFCESDIPLELMKDPYGIAFYPEFNGRDGCRTPIPFDSQTKDSWLPVDKFQLEINIESQESDPESVLSFTRKVLHLRKEFDFKKNFKIKELDENRVVIERSGQKNCRLNINFPKETLSLDYIENK